jgi:hypothetical protein
MKHKSRNISLRGYNKIIYALNDSFLGAVKGSRNESRTLLEIIETKNALRELGADFDPATKSSAANIIIDRTVGNLGRCTSTSQFIAHVKKAQESLRELDRKLPVTIQDKAMPVLDVCLRAEVRAAHKAQGVYAAMYCAMKTAELMGTGAMDSIEVSAGNALMARIKDKTDVNNDIGKASRSLKREFSDLDTNYLTGGKRAESRIRNLVHRTIKEASDTYGLDL